MSVYDIVKAAGIVESSQVASDKAHVYEVGASKYILGLLSRDPAALREVRPDGAPPTLKSVLSFRGYLDDDTMLYRYARQFDENAHPTPFCVDAIIATTKKMAARALRDSEPGYESTDAAYVAAWPACTLSTTSRYVLVLHTASKTLTPKQLLSFRHSGYAKKDDTLWDSDMASSVSYDRAGHWNVAGLIIPQGNAAVLISQLAGYASDGVPYYEVLINLSPEDWAAGRESKVIARILDTVENGHMSAIVPLSQNEDPRKAIADLKEYDGHGYRLACRIGNFARSSLHATELRVFVSDLREVGAGPVSPAFAALAGVPRAKTGSAVIAHVLAHANILGASRVSEDTFAYFAQDLIEFLGRTQNDSVRKAAVEFAARLYKRTDETRKGKALLAEIKTAAKGSPSPSPRGKTAKSTPKVTLGKVDKVDEGLREARLLLNGEDIGNMEIRDARQGHGLRGDPWGFDSVSVTLWEPYEGEFTLGVPKHKDAASAKKAALARVQEIVDAHSIADAPRRENPPRHHRPATLYRGDRSVALLQTPRLGWCLTDDPNRAGDYARSSAYLATVAVDFDGLTVEECEGYDRTENETPADDPAFREAARRRGVDVLVYEDEGESGQHHWTWRLVSPRALAAATVTEVSEQD
jgi:hypothetical protein